MTEKLFYNDSHMTEFTAMVRLCQKEEDDYKVVLSRTAFFPEGGGQYADTGVLDDVEVFDVQEVDGEIYHMTKAPPLEGKEVKGKIDWNLRFMKMQQHTGEHIVSGLVHKEFGYNNVGFHLGSEDCTMDFSGELSRDELQRIEWKANEAVAKNIEVQILYPSKKELEQLSYRSKIEIEGQVRIVTIEGYDCCACCAPHVKKTGEIGMIRLTNVQRYKGGVRVTMLCGFRALSDYRMKEEQTKKISSLLCVKENEVASAVEKLKEEQNVFKQKLLETQRQLLSYRAKEVAKDFEKVVILFETDLKGEEIRTLMNLILKEEKKVCAIFQKTEEHTYRYVIGSKEMDVRFLASGLKEKFDGRGGGKPEMIQGSVSGSQKDLKMWLMEKLREVEYE